MGTTVMGGEALSTQIENLHSPGCERMWFISSPPSLASEPRLEVADEATEAGIMGGLICRPPSVLQNLWVSPKKL